MIGHADSCNEHGDCPFCNAEAEERGHGIPWHLVLNPDSDRRVVLDEDDVPDEVADAINVWLSR